MKNRMVSITLAVMLALSLGLIGCASEEVPEITKYNLTISSTEGGSVTSPGETGPYTYDEGEAVNLVAVAEEGYRFVNWTGDVDTIANINSTSTTITMNGDYSITAKFAVKQYTLVIHSTEGGSVTTPGESAYTYDKGEVVNLAAVADEGYQFINWTGDVTTIADVNAASTTVTMNGGYSITANFVGAIRDWYDLDAIRNNLDGTYVLMNAIDSTSAGYTELASRTANEGKGWEPVGSLSVDPSFWALVYPSDPFVGTLNGQGYEIRGLFINRPDEDGVGLFGCVGDGAITNLGVVNVEVTGHVYVGGLVGENHQGTVSNSYSTGSVTGGIVGGLVGGNRWDSYVSNSYSTGSVIGVTGSEWVGGLVGANWGIVSDSYATGSVTGHWDIGGLVGGNWGAVSDSHSSGSVAGTGQVGGLLGWQHHGTLSNSYSMGSVTAEWTVGGLVGGNRDSTVSNSHYSYDEVLINGRNVITTGALSKKDFEQWLANHKSLDINDRLSQEDGYYLINNITDFKSLLAFSQDGALKFRLTNDLNLGADTNFYIPYLAGEFDGNGHKITNLSVSFDFITQVGLFGYIASGGAVNGVSAEDVNISGNSFVGGLVGENDGTVSNSYSTGSVGGDWSVGGLVGCIGWNGGTVKNSYYSYDAVLINGRHMITIGALFNEDFDQWLANDKFLDVSKRLSQEDDYYLINNVNDFKELLAFGQDDSLRFRLKSDLDLGNDPDFYIPYLAGEFDGNGHKIRNLHYHFDFASQVGLFGYLASGAKVSEVGVENVEVTATSAEQVGGLVGGNSGTVSNSYSSGSVTGSNYVGGLVGWNEDTVSNSYSTGSATGNWGIGGLVGWNCFNVGGTVGTVSNSYSTGRVTADINGGGFIGYNDATVSNSLWDIETSRQATSDGGTGKTSTQMKTVTTFLGAAWNIIAVANPSARNPAYVWNIVDGQTYPFLSWQA